VCDNDSLVSYIYMYRISSYTYTLSSICSRSLSHHVLPSEDRIDLDLAHKSLLRTRDRSLIHSFLALSIVKYMYRQTSTFLDSSVLILVFLLVQLPHLLVVQLDLI
jgi:hypothetical protein